MLRIKEAIVVEGRYDKNTLSQVVDTLILETGGFHIFKDPEQMALLRRAAQRRGLIVLTDSDGAGFVIRNRIRGAVPQSQVKHAYIPDVYGKERRKRQQGKEGKLGVEGMTPEILLACLKRAGATILGEDTPTEQPITKQDLFDLGLSGGANASKKRKKLMKKLALPEHLSPNGLLQALSLLYTREELTALAAQLETEHD